MDRELFSIALGLQAPLYIDEISFDKGEGSLHIHINFERGSRFSCSECGAAELPVHDTVEKTWRHLNFFQYKCYIHMRTPRTRCEHCGERLWLPPWSRKQSGFTLLFEAFVMSLSKEMSVSSISELVGEQDTRLWRIIRGYVDRAYARKIFSNIKKIGVDETSSRKGHNYVTVVTNMENHEVLFAAKGKDSSTIKAFIEELPKHECASEQIEEVTIDMSPAFIFGVDEYLPQANVTFDKFHVIQFLNKALDEIRRAEQKQNPLLKNSRYLWLKNPCNLSAEQLKRLSTLRHENSKTARAYKMKLTFQDIYRNIRELKIAEVAINKWLSWASRSRLEPIKNFAKLVRKHFSGILRYFTTRLTSGAVEGINGRIQEIKRRARGFRNIKNFIAMIYLEAAGLELGNLRFTHSK